MTRSHRPATGHGWQATPGQPIPRAARQPAANGLLPTARLLASSGDHKLAAPALGIALDGDPRSRRQGRYVVPPAHLRGKAMARG